MGDAPRGLSAGELALALQELQPWCGAAVVDVAQPDGSDDLLLFVEAGGRRQCLQLAPGGSRARVTVTARRFGKHEFARSPALDAVRQQLVGATLLRTTQPAGERRCTLWFRTAAGEQRLECELFSARGLWALVDAEGNVRELSRPVATAVRTLRRGDRYAAPPPAASPAAAAEPPPRFAQPVLAAIDAHFTAQDLGAAATALRQRLQRALERGLHKQQDIVAGLQRQLDAAADAGRLRADADLMLAYAHTVKRGASELLVPDPLQDGEQRRLPLDPSRPLPLQAKALYDRARRLEDGAAMTRQRLAAAAELAAHCERLLPRLVAAADAELDALAAELQPLGLLPRAAAAPEPAPARKPPAAEQGLRRFVSAEGYPILVGRSDADNDRLVRSVARGNDVWLHVGGGRAGSHVVVRLPKGKTASLETLLDAGTLAVHFSKARGERLLEVIYTQARFVRKPKGLPPGAVVPSQTKTLAVRLDEARLQRLLDSAG